MNVHAHRPADRSGSLFPNEHGDHTGENFLARLPGRSPMENDRPGRSSRPSIMGTNFHLKSDRVTDQGSRRESNLIDTYERNHIISEQPALLGQPTKQEQREFARHQRRAEWALLAHVDRVGEQWVGITTQRRHQIPVLIGERHRPAGVAPTRLQFLESTHSIRSGNNHLASLAHHIPSSTEA